MDTFASATNTSRKRNLSELLDKLIKEYGFTEAEVAECAHIKKMRKIYKILLFLLSSDWFHPILLSYLTLIDIAKLDTSFCNYNDRPLLQRCFAGCKLSLVISSLQGIEKALNWILLKNLSLRELRLEFVANYDTQISNNVMFRLTQKNPNLESLSIKNECSSSAIFDDKCFHFVAAYCRHLKYLNIEGDVSSQDNIFATLAKTCCHLKSIKLLYGGSYDGLQELLQTNSLLEHLEIESFAVASPSSKIVEYLGQYCPLLQTCVLQYSYKRYCRPMNLTNAQIEAFTQGCRNLTTLQISTSMSCNKLFQCIGNYCPLLKILYVKSLSTTKEIIETTSMDFLSKGCRFLRDIEFRNISVPPKSLAKLVKNCVDIDNVYLDLSDLTDEGLTELAKLKKLEYLYLLNCCSLTEQGIINLLKQCYNLKGLRMTNCQFTDYCLFVIADNCPNLEWIDLEGHTNVTLVGVITLFSKCLLLKEIEDFKDLPNEIVDELNKRSKYVKG